MGQTGSCVYILISPLLPSRFLQIRALQESMERQQNESTGDQECAGENSVCGSPDVAPIGVGLNVSWNGSSNSCSASSDESDSSLQGNGAVQVGNLYFGDRSSSSGMSSTPQSSHGSPQVTDAVGHFCHFNAVIMPAPCGVEVTKLST